MLFKDYHIPMIRSGSKTVTRREWAENYAGPNVGTVVAAKTEMLKPDDECDCFIRITGKRQEPLGEISEESARREGDYDGVEDFRDGYEEVYGADSWDPEKVVDVVEFEYVGRERPSDSAQQTTLTDGGTSSDETERHEKTLQALPRAVELGNLSDEVALAAVDSVPKLDRSTVRVESIDRQDDGSYEIVITGEKSEFAVTRDSDAEEDDCDA